MLKPPTFPHIIYVDDDNEKIDSNFVMFDFSEVKLCSLLKTHS